MQNIKSIINHTISTPHYNLYKLKTQNELMTFKSKLPLNFQNWIDFIYIKNNNIFFVLKHPVFEQEFKHNLSNIKFLLKTHQIQINDREIGLKQIKFFITNKPRAIKNQKTKIKRYPDKSFGIFQNQAKNTDIHKIFEEIKDIINENKIKYGTPGRI